MDPSAAESARRSGDALLRHKTAYLGRVAAGLLAEHERLAPKARLLTYADVESLWSEVVAPPVPDLRLHAGRRRHGPSRLALACQLARSEHSMMEEAWTGRR